MTHNPMHDCPRCQREKSARITDSRPVGDSRIKRRRRYCCTGCDHRFTTYEVLSANLDANERARAYSQFIAEVEALTRRFFADPETGRLWQGTKR